jgi:DNA-binding HxlR family transcriptional regulator
MVKGKRTDLADADCAIARSVQVIGDWWSILLIREAFIGAQRFNEFQKSLGLAKNILSTRLKKLVAEGILRTEPDPAQPAYKRYVLTRKGEQLHVVLVALWQWGEEFCPEPFELTREIVDVRDGEPLAKLRPAAKDGRVIGPRDFTLADIRRKPSATSRRRAAKV